MSEIELLSSELEFPFPSPPFPSLLFHLQQGTQAELSEELVMVMLIPMLDGYVDTNVTEAFMLKV